MDLNTRLAARRRREKNDFSLESDKSVGGLIPIGALMEGVAAMVLASGPSEVSK